MQVTEIDADGLKHEFKVVIPADHLDARLTERLNEIARTIQLPGFRPGKVPVGLVRRKYGESVWNEVLEKALNDGAHAAISEKGLRPAMQPKITLANHEQGVDLEITVAVEVLPEITFMDFSTLTLQRETAPVPDEEVDTAIARISERNETSEKVERASKSGDVVVIDFVGKKDGEPFPGGAAEGYQLKLGSGTFIPGFEDQLIGKSAGDEPLVKVTFPEAYGNAELAGKPVEFEVKVTEVREARPATVDDEFAKSLGLESVDALKSAVREEIGREISQLARLRLKRKLLDQLADHHDFLIPPTMADREFEALWTQVEADREAGRLEAEDAAKSEDELKAEYRKLSERRVRLGLLLAEVAQVHKITVAQEDVNQAMLAEVRRHPGQEHLVFEYYRNNPQALEALQAPILEDKVIDFILELAKIEDKEISVEDLRKDPEEAQAGEETAAAKPKKKSTKKKAE